MVDDDAGAAVTTRSVNARVPALTQPPVRPGRAVDSTLRPRRYTSGQQSSRAARAGRAVAAEGGGWYVDADGVVAAARR